MNAFENLALSRNLIVVKHEASKQPDGFACKFPSPTSPITLADTLAARDVVDAVLDQDFFSLRVGNLPDRELDYVKALAALGPGEHTPADIAKAMGATRSATIGSFSRRLTERGLFYSTKRGRAAFTVPQFDRYVARAL